jgi:23S rRNA pseudouridine1911/1915/1917 synthase
MIEMAMNHGFEYREQVGADAARGTLLAYLVRRYRHSSEAQWLSRLEDGEILLDRLPALPDAVPRPGQRLVWRRPPWNEPEVPLAYAVLHEDDDLLAVAKPSGLPTMPGGGFLEHTLLALVRKNRPGAAPAHRLGRSTSGIVLFACTPAARSRLSAALRQNEVTKVYRTLASGVPSREHFSIETPIGPVPHPQLGTLHAACTTGKRALSRVRILERRGDASLIEVRIETGRPHQIRIHLAAAGHPLVGDPLFTTGGGFRASGTALPGDLGYLLHAERLRLIHPASRSPVEIWCCPPPGLQLSKDCLASLSDGFGGRLNQT